MKAQHTPEPTPSQLGAMMGHLGAGHSKGYSKAELERRRNRMKTMNAQRAARKVEGQQVTK